MQRVLLVAVLAFSLAAAALLLVPRDGSPPGAAPSHPAIGEVEVDVEVADGLARSAPHETFIDPRELADLREALDQGEEVGPEGAPEEEPIGDPVVMDGPASGDQETDFPFEESLGREDLTSDAPFDGPATGAAIGIGGNAGEAFGPQGGSRRPRAPVGGERTGNTVRSALEWLSRHQNQDGFWDADGFGEECKLNLCGGAGAPDQDPTVTGLSLLVFLGAGETHQAGRYRKTVRQGLSYLKQIQDPEGCYGPRTGQDVVHRHAICTLAMAEAYARTDSPLFRQSAQRGIDLLISSARVGDGAWAREVRGTRADPATSFWAILALKSAGASGLRVTKESFPAFLTWLERATGERGEVDPAADPFPLMTGDACTAAGILGRICCGEDPTKSAAIRNAAALLVERLPTRDSSAPDTLDFDYWYFGSLASLLVGGPTWKAWGQHVLPQLLELQVKEGDEKGSWDPAGPEGKRLGRVGSTALMAMSSLVLSRYSGVAPPR